jgi:hypothetical protein
VREAVAEVDSIVVAVAGPEDTTKTAISEVAVIFPGREAIPREEEDTVSGANLMEIVKAADTDHEETIHLAVDMDNLVVTAMVDIGQTETARVVVVMVSPAGMVMPTGTEVTGQEEISMISKVSEAVSIETEATAMTTEAMAIATVAMATTAGASLMDRTDREEIRISNTPGMALRPGAIPVVMRMKIKGPEDQGLILILNQINNRNHLMVNQPATEWAGFFISKIQCHLFKHLI